MARPPCRSRSPSPEADRAIEARSSHGCPIGVAFRCAAPSAPSARGAGSAHQPASAPCRSAGPAAPPRCTAPITRRDTWPMPGSKVASMRDAIAELVRDGDTVAIEGLTHLISFAAGHEIIRQGRRDLTLARLTPDLIYDQMVAAGVARKLVFSWLGNPGVGGLNAIRRRIERAAVAESGQPALELEEYSHHGM